MAIPTGTEYYRRLIANHTLLSANFTYFTYQFDASILLEEDAEFKSNISSEENITVYDVDNDTECPRYVFLDIDNNKLLIYFNASTNITQDREFCICVGNNISKTNNAETFFLSGYEHYWPINEFENGPVTIDVILGKDGILNDISKVTIGNSGTFGNRANFLVSKSRIDVFDDIPLSGSSKATFEGIYSVNSLSSSYYNYLIRKYNGVELKTARQGGIRTIYFNIGNAYAKCTLIIGDNVPFHCMIVYNGDGITNPQKVKMFINSEQQILTFYGWDFPSMFPDSASSSFGFGRSDYTSVGFTADEVSISPLGSYEESWASTRYNMFFNEDFWDIPEGLLPEEETKVKVYPKLPLIKAYSRLPSLVSNKYTGRPLNIHYMGKGTKNDISKIICNINQLWQVYNKLRTLK